MDDNLMVINELVRREEEDINLIYYDDIIINSVLNILKILNDDCSNILKIRAMLTSSIMIKKETDARRDLLLRKHLSNNVPINSRSILDNNAENCVEELIDYVKQLNNKQERTKMSYIEMIEDEDYYINLINERNQRYNEQALVEHYNNMLANNDYNDDYNNDDNDDDFYGNW